jgi:hypothetical protein
MGEITIEYEYADEQDEFSFEGPDPDVIWAVRDGEQIGYVQFYLFDDLDDLDAEITPEKYGWTVEGPFFHPDERNGQICYMAMVEILSEHRGSGAYDKLVAELEQMRFPVYACFMNTRLRERWLRLHRTG